MNNPELYNAIVSGLTGGMQERWLRKGSVASDYASFQTFVNLIATELDSAIAPTVVGAGDIILLQSIAQGVFANRYPTATSASAYSDIAASIAALFAEIRALLQAGTPIPITPSATGTVNTAVIQAAIDAAALAGGGTVLLGPGTFPLAASTLGETYYNDGVAVSSALACLVLRSKVRLMGSGVGITVLKPPLTLNGIYIADGNYSALTDLELDGQWVGAGSGGSGVFQLSTIVAQTQVVNELTFRNLYVHNCDGYAIGVQNCNQIDLTFENIRTYYTGADGIDSKNRGNLMADTGTLSNIQIDTFGRNLDGQTGIDARGLLQLNNIRVLNAGRAGVTQTGVRLHLNNVAMTDGAQYATLDDFFVVADDPAHAVFGVQQYAPDSVVSNGTIVDCSTGIDVDGNADTNPDNCRISNVEVNNASVGGFLIRTLANQAHVDSCIAVGCALGFLVEGDDNTLTGCTAKTCTTGFTNTGARTIMAGCNSPGCTNGLTGPVIALTLAGNAVTLPASARESVVFVTLAGEGGAADQLDNIVGGFPGQMLILSAATDTETITVAGAVNIYVNVAGAFALTHRADTMSVVLSSTLNQWCEVSRSDNAV